MTRKSNFFILQYNVRNDRVSTMISLLTDFNIQNYDVIAIQKSWRNSSVSTSLSARRTEFHLLYRSEENTRVCFYVNERIDSDSWDIVFSTSNVSILIMIVQTNESTKKIDIINVYNSSSLFYSFMKSLSSLVVVKQIISREKEVILLNDFNLHHSYWDESTRFT